MSDLSALLAGLSLFSGADEKTIELVVGSGTVESLADGQMVCREGDDSHSMFVIVDGSVRVFKNRPGVGDVVLASLGSGELVGELAMLDGRPRSASVVCTSDTTVFTLDRPAFFDAIMAAPTRQTSIALIEAMVGRLRQLAESNFEAELTRRVMEVEVEADRHRSMAHLVAGVAHELNTPLGVAGTASGIITSRLDGLPAASAGEVTLDARARDDVQEAADLVSRNVTRANRLVERFKNISVGQARASHEQLDLGEVIDDAVELFSLNARRSGLTIEVDCSLDGPQRRWFGDRGLLTQVLTNLLVNTENHAYPTGQGGPVTIGLGQTVERQHGHQRFVLSVEDRGRGMDADEAKRVFDPFFTTRREGGGTGLGLAIVKAIVDDALGGTIGVESQPGVGTTFMVSFPAESSESSEPSEHC